MKTKLITIGFILADAILLGVAAFLYRGLDRTAPVISFSQDT